jgi:hypothetical protein
MNLPASRPDPDEIRITDSSRYDDFAALASVLREQAGATVVYSPSTTTIHVAAPTAYPAPVEVRVPGPAGPVVPCATRPVQPRGRYTLGELIAYCGASVLGSGGSAGIVWLLWPTPLVAGVLAAFGAFGALGGAVLIHLENQ